MWRRFFCSETENACVKWLTPALIVVQYTGAIIVVAFGRRCRAGREKHICGSPHKKMFQALFDLLLFGCTFRVQRGRYLESLSCVHHLQQRFPSQMTFSITISFSKFRLLLCKNTIPSRVCWAFNARSTKSSTNSKTSWETHNFSAVPQNICDNKLFSGSLWVYLSTSNYSKALLVSSLSSQPNIFVFLFFGTVWCVLFRMCAVRNVTFQYLWTSFTWDRCNSGVVDSPCNASLRPTPRVSAAWVRNIHMWQLRCCRMIEEE